MAATAEWHEEENERNEDFQNKTGNPRHDRTRV